MKRKYNKNNQPKTTLEDVHNRVETIHALADFIDEFVVLSFTEKQEHELCYNCSDFGGAVAHAALAQCQTCNIKMGSLIKALPRMNRSHKVLFCLLIHRYLLERQTSKKMGEVLSLEMQLKGDVK